MIPYYTISKTVGFSGKCLWFKNYYFICRKWSILTISKSEKLFYCIGNDNNKDLKNFNPFRDIMSGGIIFGYNGYNYWISFNCLFGKLIKNNYY